MKKLVVALAVLAVSAGAYAADSAAGQSEFYHQAVAGEHEGTAGLGLISGSVDAGGGDIDFDGQALMLGYEYGINEAWAVGVTLGYTQLKIDSTPSTDQTGMDNLTIDLKGKHMLGTGLRYGASLDLALEKGEVKSNGDTNTADGGISIAPYVGYEWMKDACAFGGKLSYEVGIQDRETENAGTTTEEGGGHDTTLAGFYEHTMNDKWTLGGSVAYAMTSDSEPQGGADVDEGTTTTLQVYAPIRMVGPGTLIPSIASAMTSADSGDVDAMTLQVRYRMGF